VKSFTRSLPLKRIADSTVRRLSLYLRFLEDAEARGSETISSQELAKRGATTSAQVRKDLSFFGSFGKRGLGYAVPELASRLRQILGLEQTWSIIIVGAGKIGSALAQYRGFRQRGFAVVAVYDSDPSKIGSRWGNGAVIRDIATLERDAAREQFDIAVLATPGEAAQEVAERIANAGIRAILNFAPVQLQLEGDFAVKNVNMALELEGLSFALTNRD
jgi:redox-sensing transcriptional repressor